MALVGLKADSVYVSKTGRTHVLFSLGTISYPFYEISTIEGARRREMENYLSQHGYHGHVEFLGRAVIFDVGHADDAFLLYLAFA